MPPAPRPPPASREGSTVARSADGTFVFVADEDHSAVHGVAVPLHAETRPTSTALPGRPAQVVVTAEHVLVTVRALDEGGAGALLFFTPSAGALTEVARVTLPADAWGLALSPDGRRALVTSAWTAKVSVVDLEKRQVVATLDVAREPRGAVVLAEGDRAYVSHLVGAEVTRIDGVSTDAPRGTRVPLPASPVRTAPGTSTSASLGYAAVAGAGRVYFPRHALGAVGGDAWFGAAAVDVLLTGDDTPLAPAARPGLPRVGAPLFADIVGALPWSPGASPATDRGVDAFVQPRAAALRRTTQTLLVASEGSNAVSELDAAMLDPTLGLVRSYPLGRARPGAAIPVASAGGAPSGIALSADEETAWVHCRSTDELAEVTLAPADGRYLSRGPRFVALGPAPTDDAMSLGRRLFFDATDELTSGKLACAGCHPDGRDDGHVWHEVSFDAEGAHENAILRGTKFTTFVGGLGTGRALVSRWGVAPSPARGATNALTGMGAPRQTPMLAGRVDAAGPYGWHGESPTLVARLVAGFGLHRWGELSAPPHNLEARALHLATYLRQGLVPPPGVGRPLTDEERAGQAIFESAQTQCATCHAPSTGFTDRSVVPIVAPPAPAAFGPDASAAYKTPSLRGVGGSAPYFHDGREPSLEKLVDGNADRMGKTSHLDEAGRRALVAYLRTL